MPYSIEYKDCEIDFAPHAQGADGFCASAVIFGSQRERGAVHRWTGERCESEEEAADAGRLAGMAWVDLIR